MMDLFYPFSPRGLVIVVFPLMDLITCFVLLGQIITRNSLANISFFIQGGARVAFPPSPLLIQFSFVFMQFLGRLDKKNPPTFGQILDLPLFCVTTFRGWSGVEIRPLQDTSTLVRCSLLSGVGPLREIQRYWSTAFLAKVSLKYLQIQVQILPCPDLS